MFSYIIKDYIPIHQNDGWFYEWKLSWPFHKEFLSILEQKHSSTLNHLGHFMHWRLVCGNVMISLEVIGFLTLLVLKLVHYNDVIMSAMASQITSLTIVYSKVYWGADQRKHQSSLTLAFVTVTGEFPTHRASNAENVSIWWCHHDMENKVINIAADDQTLYISSSSEAICWLCKFNSSPLSAVYMHPWIESALVQIMACPLIGAKPLFTPMLGYCQLDP